MNAPRAARMRGLFCLTRNVLPTERSNAAPAGTAGLDRDDLATGYFAMR
jgi:hypothetical protein